MYKKLNHVKSGQKYCFTLSTSDRFKKSNKYGSFVFQVVNKSNFCEGYIDIICNCKESTNLNAFEPERVYTIRAKPKTIFDIMK